MKQVNGCLFHPGHALKLPTSFPGRHNSMATLISLPLGTVKYN